MWTWELRDGFGFDHLHRVERPDPQPGPGQVLVRMRAASLNYRDLLVVKGLYNPKMPLPRVPLSDGAGEVVALGPGVTRVQPGDRVAGCFMQRWIAGPPTEAASHSALGGAIDGVLSELVVFEAEGVVPIPAQLSYEEAATLPCAGVTAWNGVIESGVRPGQTVLTLGTGGVSLFALQFAVAAGARVIITSSSDEKLARARDLGAAETINYRSEPQWDRRVRELTDGLGADLVVELGGAGTLPLSLRAVGTGGTIALIGVLTGAGGEINPVPALMNAITIRGIYVGSQAMFEAMNRAIPIHQIQPVVDRTFAADEIVEALKHMESGGHFGKIVLKFP